jgi:hypothetical protein
MKHERSPAPPASPYLTVVDFQDMEREGPTRLLESSKDKAANSIIAGFWQIWWNRELSRHGSRGIA